MIKWRAGILFGLAIAADGCGLGAIGNGDVTTQSRSVAGFSRIDAAGSGVVHVREGDAYRVSVTTDSNIQPLVETRVQGDTLIIDERDVWRTSELRVDIQLPTFAGGTLSGSGAFDASVTSAHDVGLTLSGSGALGCSGPAAAIHASLSGSGTLRLAGAADLLAASLSGSGQLDARDLTANQAMLSLVGSGGLQATAVQSVSLQLTGSGDIDWWGPATVVDSTVAGSGRIVHH